jgi:hypothetical protein
MAIRQGIKYIKVAKVDGSGQSKANTLRQLQEITLNYSDIGPKTYKIRSRTEYDTYYLFSLDYANPSSSIDKGILDYTLDSGTITTGPAAILANQSSSVTGYPNSTTFFNSTTGLYNFSQRLPNVIITFTGSAQGGPAAAGDVQPIIRLIATSSILPRTIISQSTNVISAIDVNVTVSGSFTVPAEDTKYYLEVANGAVATTPCNFSSIFLKVTQSISARGNSGISTVLSPDTPFLFTGTDCDVTYGYVDEYPISQYRQSVDYSTGIKTPTNIQAIISQSAVPAIVQDYNYEIKRHTRPRYEGSRTQTYRLNQYTSASNSIIIDGNPYEGDTGYIKDPGVELNRVYFGWFNNVYGASPEINNAVNINVKYLVDKLGNTYSPNLTKYFLGELRQNFTDGENLQLNFVDDVGGTNTTGTVIKRQLNGDRPIIRSGAKAAAVLYSQTGSGAGAYTGSLIFNLAPGIQAQTVLADYKFQAVTLNTNIPAGITQIIPSNEKYDFSGGYNTGTGEFTFGSTPPTDVIFSFSGQLTKPGALIGPSSDNTNVRLSIVKNTEEVASQIYTLKNNVFSNTIVNFTVNTSRNVRYQTGDVVKIYAEANNNNAYIAVNSVFQLGQFSVATVAVNNSKPVTASYFFSNSFDSTILTASAQFAPILGNTSQIDIAGSGFDPVLDTVSFNVGDQLRFENDENKVYTINRIISSSIQTNNKETYLLLDRPLLSNINIDYFLLRRFIDDPSNIIVQGIKSAGGTGAGSIRPKYVEDELDDKMSSIVQKLNRENSI